MQAVKKMERIKNVQLIKNEKPAELLVISKFNSENILKNKYDPNKQQNPPSQAFCISKIKDPIKGIE